MAERQRPAHVADAGFGPDVFCLDPRHVPTTGPPTTADPPPHEFRERQAFVPFCTPMENWVAKVEKWQHVHWSCCHDASHGNELAKEEAGEPVCGLVALVEQQGRLNLAAEILCEWFPLASQGTLVTPKGRHKG